MPYHSALFETMDHARAAAGFLSLTETAALADRGNVIFDPFSTLIARGAGIGEDNTFYPNTRFLRHEDAVLEIGSGNVFHSNTLIEATTNEIIIGDDNQFGEGVVCLRANTPEAGIQVGSNGRYVGVVNLYGRTRLDSGSQILGNVTAYSCSLGEGHAYSHPVPDERGAVLKGNGTARQITLRKGQVIEGWGIFSTERVTNQSSFHPGEAQSRE
jgi:hypothetical protein